MSRVSSSNLQPASDFGSTADLCVAVQRKPRVLGVIASSTFGGAETVFAQLLEGLSDRYDLYVICDRQGGMIAPYGRCAVDLIATDLRAPSHWMSARLIAGAVRQWSIDLVHTHLWNADVFGGLAARCTGRPCISTVHGSNFLSHGSSGLHRGRRQVLSLTYRSVYWLFDEVLAPSAALAADISGRTGIRVSPSRIRIVPNGIDVADVRRGAAFGAIPDAVARASTGPLVACVGNLYSIKGQEWLLRSWPAVLSAMPEATLVVVGDGDQRTMLQTLAVQLGIDRRTIFTGALENPLAVMRRADVVVMPSLSEGLPITLLEAMALERPVVATRAGGIPEVVTDGENGLLVPPRDHEATAAAIVSLLADERKASRLTAAALLHVGQHWSSQRTVELTAKSYADVLARRAARQSPR